MKITLNEEAAIKFALELTKLSIEQKLINNYGEPVETADAVADFFNELVIKFTSSDN